ncbi:ankyrin repeat domain-containing protein [Sphingomonas mollis]|uniref:Ankyrin repeat domain-containing protein n=1 Tax=Sphingomonas mollis TaxID=2795726 RepID=A0ABS0XQV4_9SPHN|nr:ankyrin repeat domain-containing protein [Sphingomonas sp. BT553]MBJ6122407.1 ankyrin repeat domain-containing protein [Sphingomonas sp. BT553]
MNAKLLMWAAPALFLAIATPVAAQQQSESYKFLQAVKDAKGNDVIAMLDKPGSSIVNARDINSGEGALHIVVKRGDETYLRYLLQKGADANIRDRNGNTPLILAVQGGQRDMIPILAAAKANPNLGNQSGVTPLILAVQGRSIDMVRLLLAAKADPDQADVMAGLSAREYAAQDTRNTAIAKLFDETPKRTRAAVSGPRL